MSVIPLAPWVPNALCCNTSNPRDLCPDCKAAFDAAHHHVASYTGAANQFVANLDDPDDLLPLPAFNAAVEGYALPPGHRDKIRADSEQAELDAERTAQEVARRLGLDPCPDDPDCLGLPAPTVVPNQLAFASHGRQDDDLLPY
jgi:hypothetical protein